MSKKISKKEQLIGWLKKRIEISSSEEEYVDFIMREYGKHIALKAAETYTDWEGREVDSKLLKEIINCHKE